MLKREDVILFSGGAQGAEWAFGACAERYGIEEVNFSFADHKPARTRGLRILNHEELAAGEVSLAYIGKLMNRRYPDTPTFRKILQSIWYQINSGQEIYVVGAIQPDYTVRGGTGWGAEFAKLCNKPLWVFDQDKRSWFQWNGEAWEARTGSHEPVVGRVHFTGTGTRMPSDAARKAITGLFERSFPK
jgi:hypothetical protein